MIALLVIEDDIAHAELIKRAFEPLSDQVHLTLVGTLKAAYRHLAAQTPDVILVDLLLPDGKGTDLLTEHPNATNYPVIVMTSHGDEHVAVEAMKAGALDYVVKTAATLVDLPRLVERSVREWGHIVARKRAEEDLRRTAAELRAFIESASEGMVIVNETGVISLVNRQLERIFDYNRDALIGQPVEILLTPDCHAIHQQHRNHYLADPSIRPMGEGMELVGLRRDGTTFPVEISLSYIHSDKGIQVMALVSDISDRKRLQAEALEVKRMQIQLAQEKALREYKDRFLSLFSHEFRTPLSVIRSSNDLLHKYTDRYSLDERRNKFQEIDEMVQKLDTMITDILLLSKAEMNRLRFDPQPTHVENFCRQIIATLQRITTSHQIVFNSSIHTAEVEIDHYLMDHALTNLLHNAIKYSPGRSQIRFELACDAHQIIFRISDEGIGIPEEDLKHIFEPFHRASNAVNIQGTGIGLAVVKEFVTMHHGTIRCESTIGIGTTFTITLPPKSTVD